MKKKIAFSIAGSSFVVAILVVISLLTESWLIVYYRASLVNGDVVFVSYPQGLWPENGSNTLFAVKTLMISGIICMLAATFCFLILGLKKFNKPIVAVVLLMVAGLTIGISLVVYSVSYNPGNQPSDRAYYSYSYILGWISVLGTFLLAMIAAMFH